MIETLEETLKRIRKNREKAKKEIAKIRRENNKMARDLSYPRGVKQMKEEGVL